MIHLAKRGKTPTDKQINDSWDNIRPQALTGPKVFGINENVKSAVFIIAAQTYNELSWLALINMQNMENVFPSLQTEHIKTLKDFRKIYQIIAKTLK